MTNPVWQRFLTPLRCLVSGGLLGSLIWQAKPLQIWAAWQSAHLQWLGLALLLQFVGIGVSSAKWSYLLALRGQKQPYLWLLGVYLVGQFANNFLPTTVGGDAVRAMQLGRKIGSFSQASASIFIERLTGFLALSLIANLTLALTYFGPSSLKLATSPVLQIITMGFTLLAIVIAGVSLSAAWIEQRFGQFLPALLRHRVQHLAQALTAYFPQGRSLLLTMTVSLFFQLIWVGVHVACGLALNVQAPLLLYALMSSLTDIVGLAPIFLNNLGAREMIFTLYLSQIGIPPATALALSFLVFTIRLAASTLGGGVILFGGADLRTLSAKPSDSSSLISN